MSTASNILHINPFRRWWDLGYRNLVPIVPPGAPVRSGTALQRALDGGTDPRGKVPGVKGEDGLWHGFKDWLTHATTEEDLDRWFAMGAGVGVRTGDQGNGLTLVMVDADTTALDRAGIIKRLIETSLGLLPVRIGRYPKAGYLALVQGLFRYSRIEFGDAPMERVEILSDGKQFVTEGIHPVTMQPYRWPNEPPAFADLPIVEAEALTRLLEDLRLLLPKASAVSVEGGSGADVDQNSLKGDPATVRQAVEATPNTTRHFPSRNEFVAFGYMIKGATQDDPQLGLELYEDWAARWIDPPPGSEYRPNSAASEWGRMKAPFKVGAPLLYETAEKLSGGRFHRGTMWLDEPGSDAPLFPQDATVPIEAPAAFAWVDPTEWEGRTVPPRQWIVEGWVPQNEVTLLYGDGGVGKTLLAQQLGTAVATEKSWLGLKTKPARVMLFLCEDGLDELQRRQEDIARLYGVSLLDLSNMRIVSRKADDNLLCTFDRSTGRMQLTPTWKTLRDDARAFKADLVIIDTISDVFGGSEIERAHVNSFAKACLGRLGAEFGGTVIALGHPSQAGLKSGEGTSGSTHWNNAVRSRLYLKHMKDDPSSTVRELTTMKANYGVKGVTLKLRWVRGAFEVIGGSMPGVAPGDGAAMVAGLNSAAESAIVAVLLERPGERLALVKNSPYFAPKILKRIGGESLMAFSLIETEAALNRLLAAGCVKEDVAGKDGSRRSTPGLIVDLDKIPKKIDPPASAFD